MQSIFCCKFSNLFPKFEQQFTFFPLYRRCYLNNMINIRSSSWRMSSSRSFVPWWITCTAAKWTFRKTNWLHSWRPRSHSKSKVSLIAVVEETIPPTCHLKHTWKVMENHHTYLHQRYVDNILSNLKSVINCLLFLSLIIGFRLNHRKQKTSKNRFWCRCFGFARGLRFAIDTQAQKSESQELSRIK